MTLDADHLGVIGSARLIAEAYRQRFLEPRRAG